MRQGWAEVKRVPATLAFVAVVGFGSGWYVNELFHAERFAIMEQQVKPSPSATQSEQAFLTWGGGDTDACRVTINGGALVSFGKEYNAVVACGITRDGVDRLTDQAISVSGPYVIDDSAMAIAVNPSEPHMRLVVDLAESAKKIPRPKGMATTLTIALWYELLLVPKSVDPQRAIHTISDVERIGGKRYGKAGTVAIRNFRD